MPSPRASSDDDNWNFNPEGVGRNRTDSCRILRIPTTATEREIKVQYRRLARIYHPDKYDCLTNSMTSHEAQEHFKHLNNAYEFITNL